MTNNNLQNTTQKTKYKATRTPLKAGGELRCSGKVSSSCSFSGTSLDEKNEIKKINFSTSHISVLRYIH